MKPFTKLQIWGPESNHDYWVSGIYKIVSYRKGRYHAYFIQDFARNWGDRVSNPPAPLDYWPTLNSAKQACRQHAETYTPARKTVIRAGAIFKDYSIQHKERAA